LEIVVQEDTTDQLLKLAARHAVDFALAGKPIKDQRFAVHERFAGLIAIGKPAGAINA
jgi:hypothetical protein